MNDPYNPPGEPGNLLLRAGLLTRELAIRNRNLHTLDLRIADHSLLHRSGKPANECRVSVSRSRANRRPRGITADEAATIRQTATEAAGTDTLAVDGVATGHGSDEAWADEIDIQASQWGRLFGSVEAAVTNRNDAVTELVLAATDAIAGEIPDISVFVHYRIHKDYPVIRKWIEIANNGQEWIRLSRLTLDELDLGGRLPRRVELTPSERGALSSIVAFEHPDGDYGVILGNEVPSALRFMGARGEMGYANGFFEWVLGPNERFASEPVFQYAYLGDVERTISAFSFPLDRTVEMDFQRFLTTHLGVADRFKPKQGPVWCTWSNFGPHIHDNMLREQALLASRAGFSTVLLDAGWQTDGFGMEADPDKFPDLAATCGYIRSMGLDIGLWTCCFRSADSPDLAALPDARSLPLIQRRSWDTPQEAYAMSFAGAWRNYYADSVVELHRKYGAGYFKQDLSNVQFGDIAKGHDSRTLKESLLRGLRGLLEAQDKIRTSAPEVTVELTHEIYWGTPGIPCDLAVLKHADLYHIPPNDYSGVGYWKDSREPGDRFNRDVLRAGLLEGCYNARLGLYRHRGLPLHCLEYYAAATYSFDGSLTPDIQDRQLCGLLLGPIVFAGDLATLSDQNLGHYRNRLAMIHRLLEKHAIHASFQYSGVPAPTDTDWHWWGKLNPSGGGIVVVIRGNGGSDSREINIPWVDSDSRYRVSSRLAEREWGTFTGAQLQSGWVRLNLPPYGQELLEVVNLDSEG